MSFARCRKRQLSAWIVSRSRLQHLRSCHVGPWRLLDNRRENYASSIRASPSPTSLHSRLRSVSRLTPLTLDAHRLSAGVRNVYPRWLLMTPIACRTAFLLSRPNTAGSPIHSRLASNSVSRAESAAVSMPGAAVNVKVEVSERGGEG